MKPPSEKPKRNHFDLSFSNNLTMQMGRLYPVMCKEVIPGDSFNITTRFGIRMMPMAFPVQTRLRADVHFFYVRNRNLWKDWADFIGRTKEVTMPYLQRSNPMDFSTGSLADYMGIPTTIGEEKSTTQLFLNSSNLPASLVKTGGISDSHFPSKDVKFPPTTQIPNSNGLGQFKVSGAYENWGSGLLLGDRIRFQDLNTSKGSFGSGISYVFSYGTNSSSCKPTASSKITLVNTVGSVPSHILIFRKDGENIATSIMDSGFSGTALWQSIGQNSYESAELNDISGYIYGSSAVAVSLGERLRQLAKAGMSYYIILAGPGTSSVEGNPTDLDKYKNFGSHFILSNTEEYTITDVGNYATIYTGANPMIKINALPFRAYEAIWNGFYRKTQSDPFILQGQKEYNQYVTNNNGGADTTTPMTFNNRYWENDVFVSALPSPQQGIAPLVGSRVNDLSKVERYQINATPVGGGTPQAIRMIVTNNDGSRKLGIEEYSQNTPESTINAINDAINFGISINDFRNVNALQRWLEKNVRRGYRYKDQILTQYGVDVRYDVLDMPEFLGGVTEDINIQTITNTTESSDAVLGSYAGQGSCLAQSKHSINHYFDEHGYVIALMSIVPIPTYPQYLPKHFTKFKTLDYFFPTFNHIGLQPITNREIAPLQSANSAELDQVFGYQRPWYEYLSSLDEVHGDFRTNLKDYLITRMFGTVPLLGKQFLTVNPEELNDIFSVRGVNEDKFLGQVGFQIHAKRPISKIADGRLE